MEKLLFFDTETTGMCLWNEHPSHPKQPRVVQIAALQTDEHGEEINSLVCLLQLGDIPMANEVAKIHGYTKEILNTHGIHREIAFQMWAYMMWQSSVLIAHNIKFDLKMFDIEQACNKPTMTGVFASSMFCTMLSTTDICKLPGKRGYKWPKLAEAYRIICGKELVGAHDALADVRACKEIYFKLKETQR